MFASFRGRRKRSVLYFHAMLYMLFFIVFHLTGTIFSLINGVEIYLMSDSEQLEDGYCTLLYNMRATLL